METEPPRRGANEERPQINRLLDDTVNDLENERGLKNLFKELGEAAKIARILKEAKDKIQNNELKEENKQKLENKLKELKDKKDQVLKADKNDFHVQEEIDEIQNIVKEIKKYI